MLIVTSGGQGQPRRCRSSEQPAARAGPAMGRPGQPRRRRARVSATPRPPRRCCPTPTRCRSPRLRHTCPHAPPSLHAHPDVPGQVIAAYTKLSRVAEAHHMFDAHLRVLHRVRPRQGTAAFARMVVAGALERHDVDHIALGAHEVLETLGGSLTSWILEKEARFKAPYQENSALVPLTIFHRTRT